METSLHYEVYGIGETIYFIHGLALDLTSMQYIYEACFDDKTNYRRVYIDLPGMGKSAISSDVGSTDDILTLLESFILSDAKERRINLCGHSFGGYLCLALAYRLKERINKIFLTCPVVKADKKERMLASHYTVYEEPIDEMINKKEFEAYLSINVRINKQTWKDYTQSVVPGIETFDKRHWRKILKENYPLSFEQRLLSDFPEVSGYLLLGENDNVVGYQDQLNVLSKKISHCLVMKNSGHNLQIDEKDQVLKLFKKFLRAKFEDVHEMHTHFHK